MMQKSVKSKKIISFLISCFIIQGLLSQSISKIENLEKTDKEITVGAARTTEYLPLLKNKTVAVVANHTSTIGTSHLVDSLLKLGVKVTKVFSPEHGFRGEADAGEHVKTYKDKVTGLPIISLYGNNKKPSGPDLNNIDIVIFDIQDVGVRFYTYLSTMHYVMEACAEKGIPLLILDRPNPNGYFVDGPVLEEKYKSFVGLHPVPLVHGLTLAEYAQMINGEGWLANGIQCPLHYVLCKNYTHSDYYQLPIHPSPNLPNMASIYLYPSLGLFEGTMVSVGRGTEVQFQVIGHPTLTDAPFTFTPKSMEGAKYPPYEGKLCNGFNLSDFGQLYMRNYKKIYLYWLTGVYENTPDKSNFFQSNGFFNLLAGNNKLKQQIVSGMKEEEIRKSWQEGLIQYKVTRKKYLLYPDFE